MRFIATLLALAATTGALAQSINVHRAHSNYQLFCQGCHTPDGMGANAVPRLKDTIGYFLATPAGREYLVRVPGSATSALSSADLAEVLNWIVLEFAGDSLTQSFAPYTTEEVATLRTLPLNEVVYYRAQLLGDIAIANARE